MGKWLMAPCPSRSQVSPPKRHKTKSFPSRDPPDQDQPFIPWWDEGLVKGPERKGGGALGLLERLTVCWDTDGGPGRGGASVGTGLFRLGERAGESPRWVNGYWGTSREGPESQARRSPGPSPPLLLQSKDQKMVGDITGAQSYASTASA